MQKPRNQKKIAGVFDEKYIDYKSENDVKQSIRQRSVIMQMKLLLKFFIYLFKDIKLAYKCQ